MSKSGHPRQFGLRGAAWLLCLLPLGALADQPDHPADPASGISDPNFPQEANPAGSDAPYHGGRHRPTEEEWKLASSFLNQYSPKRMALVSELPDGPLKQHLRTVIYSRYAALRKVQDYFPQIYQVQLQRLSIEDSLFDLHRQYMSASGSQKTALRATMRQQVQALFDNVQQDRQTRINRMKTWAAELQSKRDADEHNRETVISQQLQEVIQHGPENWGRENRPRRNGGIVSPSSSPSDASPGEDFQPTTNPQ